MYIINDDDYKIVLKQEGKFLKTIASITLISGFLFFVFLFINVFISRILLYVLLFLMTFFVAFIYIKTWNLHKRIQK